ncbi:hypothetical protein BTO06_07375 [Tenacibaculum sp. SZ-18]|uniref:sensor histidine kinase n=1 Tax=Tenacibaculum sp. SZ-18 TaxID=754423 RepID=UPI000C2D4A6D|nr:sensor histidine kinase [Tenacibaculum sp. SZ-18]AUC14967.1 hypothetical protein BTO06_07375 [Tenacibaculum sp. SZ-18]
MYRLNSTFLWYTLFCISILFFNHSGYGISSIHKGEAQEHSKNPVVSQNTETLLDSGWEFYWNKLIEPEDFSELSKPDSIVELKSWTLFKLNKKHLPSFGYATYRLRFTLPLNRPSSSIFIPPAYAASKTWVNGKLISEIGKVTNVRNDVLHRRYRQTIPLDIHESNFEIIIQVVNFYHNKGGLDKPLSIAESSYLNSKNRNKIIADMLFIGCLGFIGLFFLLFFFFYWNKDKAIFYIGIACVSLSYMALSSRYAPLAELFPTMSWALLTKVEYISLFYSGTAVSLFFNTIFKDYTHELYYKILIVGFYTLSFLVIVLPAPHFTKFVLPFLIYMLLNILYAFYITIKSIKEKKHDSILLISGVLLGLIVFFLHIFIFIGKLENLIIYVNFGYVLVFLMLSMLLMFRFSRSFVQLELSRELAINQRIEISRKSNELTNVNKELKENLIQLENYNAELDSFNHIVSHDLKAPLVAMHSLITFIEEDLDLELDKNAKKHFELLKGRVLKMDSLINGLLEYSKIAKGKKSKEIFSLNSLLIELIEILNYSDSSTFHLPDEDIQVFANRLELEHVFQNLIGNAIKYNDKEKACIDISAITTDSEYIFSVKDNGPGIDDKYHSKIFEMFSQLDKNDETSTGIGLAIVQKLVAKNQGTITVDSDEGKGTTFKFTWKI